MTEMFHNTTGTTAYGSFNAMSSGLPLIGTVLATIFLIGFIVTINNERYKKLRKLLKKIFGSFVYFTYGLTTYLIGGIILIVHKILSVEHQRGYADLKWLGAIVIIYLITCITGIFWKRVFRKWRRIIKKYEKEKEDETK